MVPLQITLLKCRPEESGAVEAFTENVIELFTEGILG